MSNNIMTFPATVEEFMDEYKIVDVDHVYTNGSELVPIFRMKQWFEHSEDIVEVVRCKDCKHKDVLPDVYGIGNEALYCPEIEHYVEHDFFCKYGEKVTEDGII